VTVWVIECGAYEDQYIYGVADSLETAESYVKAKYEPADAPDLQWGPIESNGDDSRYIEAKYTYRSLFNGRDQQHVERFELTQYEVATA
jgi:hypothetical protein